MSSEVLPQLYDNQFEDYPDTPTQMKEKEDCDSDFENYQTKPRRTRRGAISYQKNDPASAFIRHLGDRNVGKDVHSNPASPLVADLPADLPPNIPASTSHMAKPAILGRRGSVPQTSATTHFRSTMKGSILQTINVEIQSGGIQDCMSNVHSWDFNVLALKRHTEGRCLFHVGSHLLLAHDLLNKMNLDETKVSDFLVAVEAAYHPENYYHNSTHAADVTQALHCLMSESKLYGYLSHVEVLAALLAAMCHDLDHPGVNQSFLLNATPGSIISTANGNESTLERHHCREAKDLLKSTGLLDHLPAEEQRDIISLMEDLILATDVSQHKKYLTRFHDMAYSQDEVDFSSKEHRRFLLLICIKAADISNPARKLSISKYWSENIMEEFFTQGDCERFLNLNVSKFCDRYAITVPEAQSGFFRYMALPLFQAWSNLYESSLAVYMLSNIAMNLQYWEDRTRRSADSSSSSSSSSSAKEQQVEDTKKQGE